jgi:putative ABC transport system permease protein
LNDVALTLLPGASERGVIAGVDDLLARYGGVGAIPRAEQLSHWSVDNELLQLQTMGLAMPVVFLLVAAFLLNVVLTRLVAVQRSEIAALKALGYTNREVAWHFVQWSLIITITGAVLGVAGGAWMGQAMVGLYSRYFEFPSLRYTLSASTAMTAAAIGIAAGCLGALGAVRRAVGQPPAEAMQPLSPTRFRRTWIERLGLFALLAPVSRMIVRHVIRHPLRAAVSSVGIGLAAAMMVLGLFTLDAIDELVTTEFHRAQRQDITMTFVEPRASHALYEVRGLPGVLAVEPLRMIPVRLSAGPRSRQVALTGLAPAGRLRRVVSRSGAVVTLPPNGLVLSRALADILDVTPGDWVRAEVLTETRPVLQLLVANVVDDYIGTSAYVNIEALHGWLKEGGTLSGAFVDLDPRHAEAFYRRVKETPSIAGVQSRQAMLGSFSRTIEENMKFIIFFNVLFSSIIAIGVVYNAARIALSERSRELASLRVLGFTRAEISAMLLGELGLVTAVGIPLGLAIGYAMAALLVQALSTELYRFPLVVAPRTFSWAAITVAAAAVASALVVRRRLDRLDLVAVLKAAQ